METFTGLRYPDVLNKNIVLWQKRVKKTYTCKKNTRKNLRECLLLFLKEYIGTILKNKTGRIQ